MSQPIRSNAVIYVLPSSDQKIWSVQSRAPGNHQTISSHPTENEACEVAKKIAELEKLPFISPREEFLSLLHMGGGLFCITKEQMGSSIIVSHSPASGPAVALEAKLKATELSMRYFPLFNISKIDP